MVLGTPFAPPHGVSADQSRRPVPADVSRYRRCPRPITVRVRTPQRSYPRAAHTGLLWSSGTGRAISGWRRGRVTGKGGIVVEGAGSGQALLGRLIAGSADGG